MIRRVTIRNRFGESLSCFLANPAVTGFAITSITGLGPGKSNINIKEIATSDGGYFGSARTPTRNIVMTIRFYEWIMAAAAGGYKYRPPEQIRDLSYRFFKLKSMLELIIETDQKTVKIFGYVESNEPVIFSDAEETQISILCPGYYFKMVNNGSDEKVDYVYNNGLFMFPFENPSLIDKMIVFGNSEQNNQTRLVYNGDSETGFEMTFQFVGDVESLTVALTPEGGFYEPALQIEGYENEFDPIEDLTQRWITFNMTKIRSILGTPAFVSGDELVISSIQGSKKAILYRGSTTYNFLDCFSHLDWLKLYPGTNKFETVIDSYSFTHVKVSIRYQNLCEGI